MSIKWKKERWIQNLKKCSHEHMESLRVLVYEHWNPAKKVNHTLHLQLKGNKFNICKAMFSSIKYNRKTHIYETIPGGRVKRETSNGKEWEQWIEYAKKRKGHKITFPFQMLIGRTSTPKNKMFHNGSIIPTMKINTIPVSVALHLVSHGSVTCDYYQHQNTRSYNPKLLHDLVISNPKCENQCWLITKKKTKLDKEWYSSPHA